jgi:hypothetical protein
MPDAETMTADPFELATAAAIADLQAALRATAPGGEMAEGAVGHGPIRLRNQPAAPEPEPEPEFEPEPEVAEAPVVPTSEELAGRPGAAAASGTAVGHGTIRLLGQSPRSSTEPATTTPEPDATGDTVPGGPGPGPVGHGTIRLHGRP